VRTLACLLIGVLGSFSAEATTILTTTNGTANFDFSTPGVLNLTLTDTKVNPSGVADNMSAFFFTLDSGTLSLTSGTGTTRFVCGTNDSNCPNGSGGFLPAGSYVDGGTVAAGWAFSSSGENFSLDVLFGPGHAGPAHTIIGAPAADNKYDAADGSIAGNGPHNPFLALSGVFQFALTGVDGLPSVTATTFQFGTADGQGQQTGTCTERCAVESSPEPLTMGLSGTGLLFIGLWRRRR
jgi:hypothetical protein